MPAIKKRGRWAADSSVRRYEKSARTMSQMAEWSLEMKNHFQWCEEFVEAVVFQEKAARAFQGPLLRKRKR